MLESVIGLAAVLILVFLRMPIAIAMGLIYSTIRHVSKRAEQWEITARLQRAQEEASSAVDMAQGSSVSFSLGASSSGSVKSEATPSALQKTAKKKSIHARRKKEAFHQALMYVMAYLGTHVWAFLVFHVDMYMEWVPSWLMIIENFCWPLQGKLQSRPAARA